MASLDPKVLPGYLLNRPRTTELQAATAVGKVPTAWRGPMKAGVLQLLVQNKTRALG